MGWLSKLFKVALIGAAIATGVGLIATPGLVGSAAAFGMTGASAFFASTFATQFVLGAVAQSMMKKPDMTGLQNNGQTVTSRNPLAPFKVIYGRTRVGGNILYMGTTPDNENKYLHQVIAIAGHEIDAFEAVYANNEEVAIDGSGFSLASSAYGNKIRIKYKLGTDDQTAFSDLVSETASLGESAWTAEHRVRGSALVYIRLEYDQDKFPNGIPNFTFKVRGKKVYDPRTQVTAWSANPALCLNDYLTDQMNGLACAYATEIDEAALMASANICDQDVVLAQGGTENRYEAHGVISTSERPDDVINKLLTAMAGKAVMTQGKWRILAGTYYTPTLTFDEGDLRSGIRVQTLVSRRENFNTIKGVFSSSVDNYIVTDFPQVSDPLFVEEDNGEIVEKSIELPFTTSAATAQRLAKIELLKARQQITTTLPLKLNGLKANVGDIINVDNERLGWNEKKFEVVSVNMTLGEIPGVDLDLREISTDVFDWSTSEEQEFDSAPNTNLPNPFNVAEVTDLDVIGTSIITPDGVSQSALLVTWTPPVNSFVTQYEVQWIRGSSNVDYGLITNAGSLVNYGLITAAADTFPDYGSITGVISESETNYNSVFVTTPYHVINSILDGAEYAVRVRSINALGVRSGWTSSNQTGYGDTEAPLAPTLFSATGNYRGISLSWVNPTVSDFDRVEIYRNTTNNSGTATQIATIRASAFIDGPLETYITRYYWLKAVDRSGNKSNFSTMAYATTDFINEDSFSSSVMNLFSEAGAYGIEPVSTLPATGDFDGQIKFDKTANKLYRWDAATSSWTDDIFSITAGSVDYASFASGIEPVKIVNELPSPSGYVGPTVVFLTTDNKLYRYTGSAWTAAIAAADVSGELAVTNFSQTLRPVEIVSSLPIIGNFQGRTVVLTTDNKLYRHTGTAWTAVVEATDISGQVSDAQIAGLAAAKVTGTITSTQIADDAISTPKIAAGAITAGTIASGAIEADKIVAGAITSAKLATGAVTATSIASDAVTAAKIEAGAITAAKLSAGAVETDKIAANAITTGKVAAGAISTDQLASNSITADKISAGAIIADKIAAGAISADKIAANSITGGLIAASGIITSAAQINDALITTAKIQDAAITAAKIGSISLVGSDNFNVKSGTSGARMEINNTVIKVYDSNGVLRVKIGDLTA